VLVLEAAEVKLGVVMVAELVLVVILLELTDKVPPELTVTDAPVVSVLPLVMVKFPALMVAAELHVKVPWV